MAKETIQVEMKDLSAKLGQILSDAAKKNVEYLLKELGSLAYDAQRFIPETYAQSGLKVRHGALVSQNYPIAVEQHGEVMRTGMRNTTAYAAIHELGGQTPPHDIVPREKHALYWEGAAHPVKKVHHPGSVIPERPFIRPAIEQAFRAFQKRIMSPEGIGL